MVYNRKADSGSNLAVQTVNFILWFSLFFCQHILKINSSNIESNILNLRVTFMESDSELPLQLQRIKIQNIFPGIPEYKCTLYWCISFHINIHFNLRYINSNKTLQQVTFGSISLPFLHYVLLPISPWIKMSDMRSSIAYSVLS